MSEQTLFGYPVHESEEAHPVGVIVKFGDWAQWVTCHMAKSEELTDDGIDRLARDLDVYVSTGNRMYCKGMMVESVFGAPAAEIAPRVFQRRYDLGMLPFYRPKD